MHATYSYPTYPYTPSEEQRTGTVRRHPVVVIGAGPVGLTAALDLAQKGVPVVVIDAEDTVSVGSRAVCYAKRALEVWDRLGAGRRMIDKGVVWKIGKVFNGDGLVYQFDLLPEPDHKIPAFINLQQYYLEDYLVAEARKSDRIELRWRSRVVSLRQMDDHVVLQVETPDGIHAVEADWVIACDGAKSTIRKILGLEFQGEVFKDRFLIADVVMKADFPAERWFWFDPPFHRRQSALLHMQPDNVWRIDFQLGWDADPEEEKKPERVIPRLKAMLGEDTPFELEWVSVYTFQCRRLERFRHGRVFFAGDSAHQVSPFGARGANSGVPDADNLGWKLKLVIDGLAPDSLLDSYSDERVAAARENLLNSTRSTDFITPKSAMSRIFRDAVLELAADHPFARSLVNSGRLSTPTTYSDSPLNTPDSDAFAGRMVPGAPATDAPVERSDGQAGWLMDALDGRFVVLHAAGTDPVPAEVAEALDRLAAGPLPLVWHAVTDRRRGLANELVDCAGRVRERYDLSPGAVYLIRPDQHVAARWRRFDAAALIAALDRATGRHPTGHHPTGR
ncbi:3-(3-hydroxy-phenyl)propionate hydroxylase [Azospirillum agricola]|uniref:FAD-dependent oxidoreductase n=1 Tax=Azospirillum agricola TaxID=1720247 RepID=UPI001AE7D430|nr:FAD-dependent oxidoreductase [Azospirillum agricola]MBP2228289.1 3-(3-hydroxy-phenyl)propionate hydroxylase [Azospirillum agricola]